MHVLRGYKFEAAIAGIRALHQAHNQAIVDHHLWRASIAHVDQGEQRDFVALKFMTAADQSACADETLTSLSIRNEAP